MSELYWWSVEVFDAGASPDAVNGLLVYRGRGGSAGRVRPHPIASSGAADIPRDDLVVVRLG
jgi:hypothetical protein